MRLPVLIALLMLTACKREPTFDERYEAAEKEISETAREIDAEIGKMPPTGLPSIAATDAPKI